MDLLVADVRKVPVCSPAEIEGQKFSQSLLFVEFYHKLIYIRTHLGVPWHPGTLAPWHPTQPPVGLHVVEVTFKHLMNYV